MNKVFVHQVTVTIGATSMEKTVYWINYMEWFGHARELFMLEFMAPLIPKGVKVPDFLVANDLNIITLNAQMDFKHPACFGDKLEVRIQTRNFRESRVEVICEIVNVETGVLIAKGVQGLAFTTIAGQIIRMPDPVRNLAKEYEVIQ